MAYQPPYGAPPPQGGYPGYGQPPPPPQGGYPGYGQAPPPQGGYPGYGGGAPPPQGGYPGYGQPQGMPNQGPYNIPAPNTMAAGGGGNPQLKAWFDAVDQDRSGRIDIRELQAALSSGGFEFNLVTAGKILRMFDRDNTGTINYIEFVELHKFIQNMSNGFKRRDKSGSGTLDGSEVRAALSEGGYQLNEPTFQLMMRKFDREKRGQLKFDDYVELSIFLSTVRNVFSFYDKQRAGQVTFNFDSFLTAGLSMQV